jgi:hypothetical protein
MKLTASATFILGLYVTLLIFWLFSSIFITANAHPSIMHLLDGFKNNTPYGYIFAFVEGVIPFIGGIIGFRKAQQWGLFKSSMGKAVFCLAMGCFTWSIGELIWSYYNFFLDANVPYPSWSDAGFVLNYPFFGIGFFILGKATGTKFGLRNAGGKIFLVLLPIAAFALSWFALVQVARGGSLTSGGGWLKTLFDIAYPMGDVIILIMAFLTFGLSFQYLGGRFRWPIFIIIFGIVVQYFADFGFSYTTTLGTYYNGNAIDLLFATSMFILAFGISLLDAKDT